MKNALKYLFLFLPLFFMVVACNDEDDVDPIVNGDENGDETTAPNLVEAAEEAGLTILLEAVGAVDGLANTLLDAPAITVFAPTNEAFENALAAFDAADLNELVEALGGIENLETVLGFHVVPAVAFADDLDAENTFTTLAGQDIVVSVTGDGVTVTDAAGNVVNVVVPDVEISNGVVHVIDGVLLPELPAEEDPNLVDAATEAGLTILLDAVGAVEGLADALLGAEAITVFAPTNDAFVAALEAFDADDLNELVEAIGGIENLETVLGFHVVPAVAFSTDLEAQNTFTTLAGQDLIVNVSGESVTVTDANGNVANVVAPDVAIANGVVHVIDAVLLPELPAEEEDPNLVDAATEAGLTILLDAVTAVDGLAETLLDAEAITVFAPTNDAFVAALEAFDAEDLDELVEAIGGIENLETVLGFHVVPAVAFSTDLESENTFTTLAGQELTVTVAGGEVTVTDAGGNEATVTIPDVAIANGVVHVIDAVLLPDLD